MNQRQIQALADDYKAKGMLVEQFKVLHYKAFTKARREEEKQEGKYTDVWLRIEAIEQEGEES